MQVSQINDHVTHAVIGGRKAINFTVSDDAELMNVLSKALYTDQPLAVIRETLCNAWDAHVEAGCTDKPIEISLSAEELVIRDFGIGIPDAMIGPVYGTYGGSTKKHDGKQTGGFGLGCKSPFAYTDHFEVTSWSKADSMMTVYNMSKSSAEVQGKPGIVPIVSVPTTEHGLQVRIKLKSPNDRGRFDQLIKRIVQNGEMNAVYNGTVLETIAFSKMKHNFLVTNHQLIETPQSILLRYGHVIYPVEMDLEYRDLYNRALKMLERLGSNNYNRTTEYKIVFQAAPNTVSITPSREALSMQEGTIQTIKKLLDKFVTASEDSLKKGCFDLLEKCINSVFISNKPAVLWETSNAIPNLPPKETGQTIITDLNQLIVRYATHTYPQYDGFKAKDQLLRIDALINFGFGDTALIKKFKEHHLLADKPKAKDKDGNPIEHETAHQWFKRNIVDPLTAGLMNDPMMHVDKLFVWCKKTEYRYDCELTLMHTKDMAKREHIISYMPWLRKIMILAHNRLDFNYRAGQFPVMKHWLGKTEDVFLYTVARSPKKVEAARAFFEKHGYTILDLTIAQKWEDVEAAAPIVKEYVNRPRRKGIPMLASCMYKKDEIERIDMTLPNKEEEQLIDTPEFVLKASYKSDAHHLPNMSATVSKFIINKWGKIGGFVVNQNQEAKYLGMGATTCEDFLLTKILEELKNNPRIRESLSFMWERSKTIMERQRYGSSHQYDREHHFLKAVYADQDLVDYFGLTQTMTKDDKLYWQMLEELKDEGATGSKSQMKAITDYLETIPVHDNVTKLFDQIRQSVLLQAFDKQVVVNIMTRTETKPQGTSSKHRQMLRDMILEAIEA